MSEPLDRAHKLTRVVTLLQAYDRGDTLAALDEDLLKLQREVSSHAAEFGGTATGELTITIKLTGDAKGCDIAIAPKLKLPGRPTPKDRFFFDEDGSLTQRNPNKGTMFEGSDLGRRPIRG